MLRKRKTDNNFLQLVQNGHFGFFKKRVIKYEKNACRDTSLPAPLKQVFFAYKQPDSFGSLINGSTIQYAFLTPRAPQTNHPRKRPMLRVGTIASGDRPQNLRLNNKMPRKTKTRLLVFGSMGGATHRDRFHLPPSTAARNSTMSTGCPNSRAKMKYPL